VDEPRSGATYPQGWELRSPAGRAQPAHCANLPDQELDTKSSTRVVYWEGNVRVEGSHAGQRVGGADMLSSSGTKQKSISTELCAIS
jgi:predicted secreted hydrolase